MKKYLLVFFSMFQVCIYAQQSGVTVTGKTTDSETGILIPGANVVEKGTMNGVSTDFDGNFSIQVSGPEAVLVISYVGYSNQEIPVGEKTYFEVRLKEERTELDDVVLVGYQKVHKRDVTGAVSSVRSDALESIPVLNVSGLIATQVTGMQNVTMTGAPAGRGALVIRGNTSIGGDIDANLAYSTPLYVVDGVQTSLEDLAGYGVSNMDFLASLNPDDIASIDILKDASAAAIYGSRGANGVIIIETKKGAALDKPEFSFSTSMGIQPQPDLVPMLAGAAERRAKMDMLYNWWTPAEMQSGHTPMVLTDSINPAFNNNIDYQGLFYKTGITQKYNFSVRGGSEKTNYRVSLGYDNQEGVIKGTGVDRITLSTNLNFTAGQKFRNQLITRFTYTDQQTGQGNPYLGSFDLNNSLPVNPAQLQSSLFYVSDERLASLNGELNDKMNQDRTVNFTISNFATLDLLDGLSANSQISFVYDSNKKNFYEPSSVRTERDGFASYALYTRKNLTAETYLSLFKNFGGGNHEVTAVLGNRVDYNQYEDMALSAIGFGSDAIKVINSRYTKDQIEGYTDISANALVSFFGRATYAYKDRYQLGVNFSMDGSSRFGKDVRWAKFPSVSAGWIVSDEPFLEPLISGVVDYLKLRGSWGINGKQFPENYLRFGAYDLGYGGNRSWYNINSSYWSNQMNVSTYGGITGVIPNYDKIGNASLSWEETKQWNIGFDLDMFNRRVSLTFDAYHKNTEKLFFDVLFPAYSGYNSAPTNVAGVINYGWESMLRYHVFPRTNDLRLELMFGFAQNKNYVSKLPNGNRDYIGSNYGYVVGRPLNLYKMFINDYIIDDLSQLPVNPFTGEPLTGKSAWAPIRPGFPIWKDLNGDYLLNEEHDQKLTTDYSPIPDIQGSFNINLQYKKWYFQAYSQFSFGADIKNTVLNSYMDAYDRASSPWAERGLADLSEYSFWQQPGDGAAGVDFPALYPKPPGLGPWYGFRGNQSMWIESGDYWKVTNASIGYTFDQQDNFMKKIGLTRLRLYTSVLNPYQWQRSKKVVDASMVNAKGETYGNGYPQARTIMIGIDTKF
ncbi:SusC/RagA family TonB-linked outer membrane protein [Sinomicrobium weinanense]|uniref:SusC/RagA family TonB-linked outer membrane protein n=1 Tax=Sinomicrobium weinanense TaxID=2842200 RepID=A0A926JPJ2_9FLAO|nr:SusC/RagA family TonB-linked outer membrane protein [Sinomicrobium weinanense]MBC9795004.1 SusC/RagA family TonB-linked outer membrane protein [Sinomicrobium weinanense]MBU3125135.1 SusC/RagA family TonB-linked outer membrane protein [Sinomicrobium weinanense]